MPPPSIPPCCRMDLAWRPPPCQSVVTLRAAGFFYDGVALERGDSSHVHLNSLQIRRAEDMKKTPEANRSLACPMQVAANGLWPAKAFRPLLVAAVSLCMAV